MLESLRAHARALASIEPAQILELAGTLRDDTEKVTALYAGNGANLEYIVSSLFAAEPQRRPLDSVSPPFIPGALPKYQAACDIIVVERPPLWAFTGKRIGDIRMPAWIRQELRLADIAAQRWQLGRHLEREVQRQIRRHEYRLALNESAAAKSEFFESFYRPYIESRHGSAAITVDRLKFASVASNATLAQLFAGQTWVAGMLLLWNGDSLRFGWFGSREDPPNRGASEVMDVLCIKMAAERGIGHINFGNSRPSLADGVVRYKRKFGAGFRLPRYPQTQIDLQIRTDRRSVRDWLGRQEFLCQVGGALRVASYAQGELNRLEFRPVCEC